MQENAHTPPSVLQAVPALPNAMNDDDSIPMTDSPADDMTLPLTSDDTETDDERFAVSQVPARIYTPPPHIAARIYRSSAAPARRKSSAASSRRNSISSTHSHSSHGYGLSSSSGANAPQSKHVAQHLRRASILADRKARLADRAAHAEQVRQRAALAKATVRDTTLSEERAQAAAQAREKNLAEIAATCAEEVKRAKAIAETIKEKREQNLLRLRQQIQDRLDEAERRREELRRNNLGRTRSRGHSLVTSQKQVEVMPQVAEGKENASATDSEESLTASSPSLSVQQGMKDDGKALADVSAPALTPEEAACKILHWWRTAHRKRAVAEFQQLGLAVDGVRDTSFEEVVQLLGQDRVLLATGKVLRICGIQQGETRSAKEVVAVRAFLSAFLILGHPTHVLSNKNQVPNTETVPSGQKAKASSALSIATASRGSSTTNTTTTIGVPVDNTAKGRQEQVGSSPSHTPNHWMTASFSPIANETDRHANPRLQELVGKARDLLICFETIVSRLTHANCYTAPPALAAELLEAYNVFYEAFIAWKARDASALVEVMIMQFVELDAIWQTVKNSTELAVSNTYRQSIRENQLQLMVRIKKLAGPEEGKKKVFDAVRKARKAKEEASKQAAAASTDMKPRQADHTIETAMGDLANHRAGSTTSGSASAATSSGTRGDGVSGHGRIGSRNGTLTSGGGSGGNSGGKSVLSDGQGGGAEFLPELQAFSAVRGDGSQLPPRLASGSRAPVQAEKYQSSPLPENRVLIHELALYGTYSVSDREFKEKQAVWMAPVFKRMRKTMGSNSQEEQEEHFYYLLTIAEVIRTKLQRMTTKGKKMHQFIGELLDTELAQRQFAMGSFSYERFFASMGQLLPKLCAPFRDDEVKDLADNKLQQGDYVDRLQALLSFVDVMLTDHINFMLSVAGPSLLQSSAKYEANRFAELVRSNSLGLAAATAAWQRARAKVLAEAAKRDPEGVNHPKLRPTPDQFYTQMLVDVFTQLSPTPYDEMPEMLLLDHGRANKWGTATRHIVTAGAVLLQCKNLLKRDVRLPWKTEAHRVMMVLEKAEKDAAAGPEDAAAGSAASRGTSNPDPATRMRTALSSSAVVDGVVAALESGRSMPAATRLQLRACVQRTIVASAEAAVVRLPSGPSSPGAAATPGTASATAATSLPQEPVLRLLLHRLRGYLVARLTTVLSAEKSRQNNAAGERLTGLGLAEFVDGIREMAEDLSRVQAVDREAHGTFWNLVAEQAAGNDTDTVTASAHAAPHASSGSESRT